MSPVFPLGRFDPRWLFPTMGTDEAALYGALELCSCSAAEESTNDTVGEDFDEALEQTASEGCKVCPLCGAIVARDGSVLR
jgi:hypothetical protein